MNGVVWLAIGIVVGLIPFAVVIWLLMHPERWWPQR